MRLIDADVLPNYEVDVIARVGDAAGPAKMRFVLWEDIQKAPVIDAKPVVHARWVHSWLESKCSACGYLSKSDRVTHVRNDTKYCPNCGAIMDKKEG